MPKERKPDLAGDDYPDVEKRVDAFMRGDKPLSREDILPEAPDLPMESGTFEVKVLPSEEDEPAELTEDEWVAELTADAEEEEPEQTPPKDVVSSTPETDDTMTDASDEGEATAAAVKDIIAKEADAVLAAADEKDDNVPARSWHTRIKQAWLNWWSVPWRRNITLLSVLLILIVLMVIPVSRYAILNAFGVRVQTSLQILDTSSQQPLRNVQVVSQGVQELTDEHGRVTLNGLRLGSHDVTIHRRAFAPITEQVTFGWGSNPLGQFWLEPTGAQYEFTVVDFASGLPIERAEVIYRDVSAFSNEDGWALLTVDLDNDTENLEIAIFKDQYRTEAVTLSANITEAYESQLVPALKHFFVSEQAGNKDVYSAYIDGEEEQVVLPASGFERDDMVLLPHYTENMVAVVSTREERRNEDGFLLSSLTIVDASRNDETAVVIAQSERIQLVDWFDDQLVFIKISSGASGTNPARQRLIRYDMSNRTTHELSASNYFQGIARVNEALFVAPSSLFQTEPAGLFRWPTATSEPETIFDREVWGVYRSGLDELLIVTSSDWYRYTISEQDFEQLDGQPATVRNLLYQQNPWRQNQYTWLDTRDGQGVIELIDDEAAHESTLFEAGGIGHPMRWLNETTLIYRRVTVDEVADYVISTRQNQPIKLRNVTPTSGLERWYTY